METKILTTRPVNFFHELAEFRSKRLELISSDLSPITLERGGKVLLQLVPKNTFDRSTSVDLNSLDNRPFPLFTGGANVRFNFDGLLTYSNGNEGVRSYVQLFHTGVIEAVYVFAERNGKRIIPSTALRTNIIDATASYLKIQQNLDVKLPVTVMLTFWGVKGYQLAVADNYQMYDQFTLDRDALPIPEVFLDSFESEVGRAMKPMFDRLWNAAGFSHCLQYDNEAKQMKTGAYKI